MLFRMVYDEMLAQAAYLIGCQRSGEAIIIDPQRDVDRYLALAEEHEVRLVAVAETHIHADFLSGARELAERLDVLVCVSDEGGDDWRYGWIEPYRHRRLRHGDVIEIGGIRLRAMHTPGHTPEHMVFEVTDGGGGATEPMGIATGDFVFVGALGRPDLLETAAGIAGVKEASARDLFRSATRFLELPDHLQVWPGHGAGSACGKALGAVPQSTVGYERRFNQSLRLAREEEPFIRDILSGQPEPPGYFARMKRLNRDGPPVLGDLPRPRALSADEVAGLDARRTPVIDTRPWPEFRGGHLSGALFAPLRPFFPAFVGSYLDPEEPFTLVAEGPEQRDRAVRHCVRIGYDRAEAWIDAETLARSEHQGRRLEQSTEIDVETLRDRLGANASMLLVDVRTAAEREEAAIPGDRHVALTTVAATVDTLPTDRPVVLYCRTGSRAAAVASYLRRCGLDARPLVGGLEAWQADSADAAERGLTSPVS